MDVSIHLNDFSSALTRCHLLRCRDSLLSDTLIRKGRVQNVLEHQPMKHPGCEHTVSLPSYLGMISSSLTNAAFVCGGWSAYRSNRHYYVRLRDNRELTMIHNLCELVRTPFFKYFQARIQCSCFVLMARLHVY
jgi:ERO1-like protein beta